MIKLLVLLVSWVFLIEPLKADYLFLLNRFGGIEIKSDVVRFYQGNKQREETVFQSQLMAKSDCLFMTPNGVRFEIEKLPKTIIHDRNRRINSGQYRLRIIGTGKAYDEIVAKLPPLADFAATKQEMTFYGEKIK